MKYLGGTINRNISPTISVSRHSPLCTVESSYVKGGNVSGHTNIGGLVGANFVEIESSYTVKVDVSGDEGGVGGLVGLNDGKVVCSYTVEVDVSGLEFIGNLVGSNWGEIELSYKLKLNVSEEKGVSNLVGSRNTNRESCFTVSSSNEPNIREKSDLIMSRRNHRILYDVETRTLFAQDNGELYSHQGVLPNQMQPLVDETEVAKISDKFMASVVGMT